MPKEGLSLIGHDDILRFEEILRISGIAAGAGITKIRITGGEPLVRKGIADFIAELSRIPGIDDISITTNGILLQSAAPALRKAGLKRINISLDSLDPKKYSMITRGGAVANVIAGIRQARLEGFSPIKVNVVAMRGINDDEIPAFALLTLDRPVHIRFIEFMPVDQNTSWEMALFIPNSEIRQRIESLGRLEPLPSSANNCGPAQMFQLPGAMGKIGLISPLSNHFCNSCNRLRLTADGKLRTCLFSDDEVDLKSLLRGNCSDADLQNMIAHAIATKPRQHKLAEPSYKKCTRGMSAIGG
jgi:GTP 3',8-cyclase